MRTPTISTFAFVVPLPLPKMPTHSTLLSTSATLPSCRLRSVNLHTDPIITSHTSSSSSSKLDTVRLRADLHARLSARAERAYMKWHSRYLRDATPVLGVRMPGIRSAVTEWATAHSLPGDDAVEAKKVAYSLFEGKFEEEKLAGVLFLHEFVQADGMLDVEDVEDLGRLFDGGGISDWNCCDWFCVKVLATLVEKEGAVVVERVAGWCTARNLWRARSSVVGLLGIVKEGEGREVVLGCCRVVGRREERFAKTSVGWALREMGKYDEKAVMGFLDGHVGVLSVESVKNATKGLSEREKKKYVGLVKQGG